MIAPPVKKENDVETVGPKTGNLIIYSRVVIPSVNIMVLPKIIFSLLLKKKKEIPIPNPSKPVVNGKTISSLG